MSAWTIFVYGLIPLIVFVLLDLFTNIKWAVFGAVAFAILDVFVTYFWFGFWDPGSIIAAVLFVILGFVTLKWQNPIFIKLQPTIMAAVLALLIGYFQFFSVPLVERYMPQLKEMAPPELVPFLSDPAFIAQYNQAVSGMVFLFVIHAAWMAYAAFKQSNKTWLAVRAFGFWALFALYAIGVAVTRALPT